MDADTNRIESAAPADLSAIRALLDEAGLPHSDIVGGPGARFWILRASDRTIGAVGLETYGRAGLLRSLVVAPEARGLRLGGRLVDVLEDAARNLGLRRLVLLTQTAEKFFAHRGYAVIDRADAPAEVRSSEEFRSLCPASATCMAKDLEPAS
jgi:amino-acid N-acetyltransferase